MNTQHDNQLSNELEEIGDTIFDDEVKKYGLQAEVIWSAMNFLKKNPDATIIQAVRFGYGEWIK